MIIIDLYLVSKFFVIWMGGIRVIVFIIFFFVFIMRLEVVIKCEFSRFIVFRGVCNFGCCFIYFNDKRGIFFFFTSIVRSVKVKLIFGIIRFLLINICKKFDV